MLERWNDAAARLRREARSLGELVSDVGRYAGRRIRERYLGTREKTDPLREILDDALTDVAISMIEAKKSVAVAIADEKNLASQALKEARHADAWAQRASRAREAGDQSLALEAAARERTHREAAASHEEMWSRQRSAVEKLKEALRAVQDRTDRAKLARDRVLAARNIVRARTGVAHDLRQLEQVITLLDRLSSDEPTTAPVVPSDDAPS